MVVCERRLWNKTTMKSAFISSLEDDALVLAAVPSHWDRIPYIGYLMSHLMKMPAAFVEQRP